MARNLVVNFDESSVSKGKVTGVKSTALTEFCDLFDLRQISFFEMWSSRMILVRERADENLACDVWVPIFESLSGLFAEQSIVEQSTTVFIPTA